MDQVHPCFLPVIRLWMNDVMLHERQKQQSLQRIHPERQGKFP